MLQAAKPNMFGGHASPEDARPRFFARWFMSTNHKDIGTLYLSFAICAGILGGAISGLMRLELAAPGIQYLPLWAGTTDFSAALHLWNVLVTAHRSEEHTSELQSLMRTSYAVFCL